MKNCKIRLSYLKWLLIIGILLFTSYRIKIDSYQGEYQLGYQTIIGTVLHCQDYTSYRIIEVKAKEKLRVISYHNKKVELGDQIKIYGKIEKIEGSRIFYLFQYDKYMRGKHIYHTMRVDDKENHLVVIGKKKTISIQLKQHLYSHIKKYKSANYLKALLLGEKEELKTEVKESYQILGISHLLALSGMHVSIITGILFKFFKKINCIFLGKILVSCFLLIYLVITNFPASLIRAVIITIVIFYFPSISKQYILITLFILLLLLNPYYLYQPAFLYSFVISFFFILLSSTMTKQSYLKRLIKISIIAFFASFPISIYFFFEINVFSIFMNILFVPIFTLFLFPLTILTFFIPLLDPIYYVSIHLFEQTVQILSNYSCFLTFPRIPIIFYIIYEILLYLILFYNKQNLIFAFLLLLLFHYHFTLLFGRTMVTMLDVGQGDSILISLSHNQGNILIDTGGIISYSKERSYYAKAKIIPYLKARGIQKLDAIIITHGDYDHMGESISLINHFSVDTIIFNNDEFNELETKLIKILNKKKIKYSKNLKFLSIDNYKLHFLNTKIYDNENDNSNVIYFNYNNYKFLFMGDAGVEKEKDILKKYSLNNIDFLKVGHHGSNTSSSRSFIDSINPKYSLISVGQNNRYGHPKKSVLDVLSNSKIYRTDQDGSVEILLSKTGYKIRTYNS